MDMLPCLRQQNKVADTELKNFPLYCPKCKQETLIKAKNLQIKVIKEPDAGADNTQI